MSTKLYSVNSSGADLGDPFLLQCNFHFSMCAHPTVYDLNASEMSNTKRLSAIRRANSATGARLPGSAAVPAAADGPSDWQIDAAADVGDVVRQEQAAAGVLVQCAEEPHRRAVPLHQHVGAAFVRRTGRGANRRPRIRADPARHRVGEGRHHEGELH